ncbi:hypothetical protein [Neobacillus niacini]
MDRESANERQTIISKIYSILEEAKRKNLMDWGELEIAESILQDHTRKS